MPLSTPTVLTSGMEDVLSTTWATGASAVVPTQVGSLLLAFGSYAAIGAPGDVTCADTGQVLTWRRINQARPAALYANAVAFWAVARTTTAMTVTFTSVSGDKHAWAIVELTGQHVRFPIASIGGPVVNAAPDAGLLDVTLSTPPLSSSIVFGSACIDTTSAGAYTASVGSGWTSLITQTTSTIYGGNIQYRTGTTSTSVPWSDVNSSAVTGVNGTSVAFEVRDRVDPSFPLLARSGRPAPFKPGNAR